MGSRVIDDVINLFDQGMMPSQDISDEEALSRGWIHEDTEKTRLIQLGSELIEVDFRKRASKCGKKVVWIAGQNPSFIQGRKTTAGAYNEIQKKTGGKNKGRKGIGHVLKKFMNAPVTRRELGKLPKEVQATLEEFLGGEITRADVAGFALMGRAMQGDIMAFKEIADRVEGKAIQRTENKNLNVNYTDFLAGKAGLRDEDDDDEPFIDV